MMTSSVERLTDEQLLAEIQQGHQLALNDLYDRFVRRVYGMALQKLADPSEAQDITHDVFVKVWQGSVVFRPQSGTVANWLLTIAHNRINDRVRQNRRSGELTKEISHDISVEPAAPGADDSGADEVDARQ